MITRYVELRVIRDADGLTRGSIQSRWEYDVAKPLEVAVNFGDGNHWTVSRDLLADGLVVPSGDGDLSFWTVRRGVLAMRMSSPYGLAVMEMQKKVIREFVAETYRLCRRGKEVIDFDDVIARIFKESAR